VWYDPSSLKSDEDGGVVGNGTGNHIVSIDEVINRLSGISWCQRASPALWPTSLGQTGLTGTTMLILLV
jgi:hypothetical protein